MQSSKRKGAPRCINHAPWIIPSLIYRRWVVFKMEKSWRGSFCGILNLTIFQGLFQAENVPRSSYDILRLSSQSLPTSSTAVWNSTSDRTWSEWTIWSLRRRVSIWPSRSTRSDVLSGDLWSSRQPYVTWILHFGEGSYSHNPQKAAQSESRKGLNHGKWIAKYKNKKSVSASKMWVDEV